MSDLTPLIANRWGLTMPTAAALEALWRLSKRWGDHFYVTSGRRSRALQERLFAEYQRGERRGPVAPPGHSDHERGRGFDAITSARIGHAARSMGLYALDEVDHWHFSRR